jgi:mono/diheme cytochrome c family protein
MKKSTHCVGVFAMGISLVIALPGCSGDPAPTTPDPMNTAGTSAGGTGGGGMGGGTGGGAKMGVQIQSPLYHVVLKGADAAPGQPPPAGYTGPAGCKACHGPNGEGVMSVGPEIRFTPKEYAVYAVRNGRKTPMNTASAMGAFPASSLSDADLDAINTWQNSFAKPTTGPGLYLAMCGNCHGPMTPSGGSAPVGIQGKPKADVVKYVRQGGSGMDPSMRTTYMPKYDTTLLTDGELDLIQAHLGSL